MPYKYNYWQDIKDSANLAWKTKDPEAFFTSYLGKQADHFREDPGGYIKDVHTAGDEYVKNLGLKDWVNYIKSVTGSSSSSSTPRVTGRPRPPRVTGGGYPRPTPGRPSHNPISRIMPRGRVNRTHARNPYNANRRNLMSSRKVGRSSFGKMKYGPKRKTSKFRKVGVVIEEDLTTNVADPRTVYFGHYTHPQSATINIIFYALAKLLFVKATHQVPSTLEETIQGKLGGITASSYYLTLRWRSAPHQYDSIQEVNITVAPTVTVKGLGELIRDAVRGVYIAQKAVISGDGIIWENMSWRPDGGGAGVLAVGDCFSLNMSDMKIAVRGQSYLKIQNATLADNLGSSDRHDVNANPVEGRCYYGKGSLFPLKYTGIGSGASGSAGESKLEVDSRYGFGNFGADDATNAEIDRILEHPPKGYMFHGIQHDRYVRLQPGTMSKSTLASTHLLSFNRWMNIYKSELEINAAPVGTKKTSIGVSRWYGVDKMIHDSTDDVTSINTECHIRLVAAAYYKRKYQMTAAHPVIDQMTTIP